MLRGSLSIGVLALVGCGVFFFSDAVRPLPTTGSGHIEVEVAIFEGGYGIGWHRRMAERFNTLHADRRIRIRLWGDPRTADIIKPRLLRGEPPDLILDE